MPDRIDREENPFDQVRNRIVKWAALATIVILTAAVWAAKNGWF